MNFEGVEIKNVIVLEVSPVYITVYGESRTDVRLCFKMYLYDVIHNIYVYLVKSLKSFSEYKIDER